MKMIRKLVFSCMLGISLTSVAIACYVQTIPSCPGTIHVSYGECINLTGSYDFLGEACVGKTGKSGFTSDYIPNCPYRCDDGHGIYLYPNYDVAGTNCPGDSTSGQCGP